MDEAVGVILSTESDYLRAIALAAVRCLRAHRQRFVLLDKTAQLPHLTARLIGAITFASSEHVVTEFQSLGVPVVNLSARLGHVPFPSVLPDNGAAGRQAAEYLLHQGHRHFAFVGLTEVAYTTQRYAGYAEALRQHGFEPRVFAKPPRHEFASADQREQVGRQWRQQVTPPLAIFCADDTVGASAVLWSIAAGLAVPGQVAVVGATNDETTCEKSQPALSSVDINASRIGHEGAALLLRLLAGDQRPPAPILVPPRGVVVRESSDTLATADPEFAEILRYVREHAGQAIGVHDLAERFGLARATLYRAFHRAIGRGPAREIMRARAQQAKALLADTDLPLKVVAARSGFSSLQRMAQTFRRDVGVTPTAYRRQFRAQ